MSGSGERQYLPVQGAQCSVNLMVVDLDVARAFYGEVLGWRFRPSSLNDQFLVAMAGGDPVAGLAARRPGLTAASVWTPYFAVRNADATAARIRERGATVAVGPMVVGDGRVGLAADRDGATFGFWEGHALAWSPGEGQAPTRLDLQTRDVFDAAVFYGEVLGWAEEQDIDIDYRKDHVLVKLGGRVILSLRGGGVQTSTLAHLRPRWLVNFAVDDVERAVTAATRAKGFTRTLQAPDGGVFTLAHHEP
ncbi:VOC family protein [Streptomyces microflavus]|uniref:VOC family protein n=1 Tax=Streptomyces microflavus TaxID=1919 RepID=A0A7H8N152_STRMI|nr:VOC family protein [Streptomyces microflavus]QKW47778.1 VOC family protein [Streptomyces microflavus]